MKERLSVLRKYYILFRNKCYATFFKSKQYRNIVQRNPKKAVDLMWQASCGHKFPWNNPQTLDEKITWLSIKSDTSMWSKCTDKYEVREYVEKKGLGEYLTKCYGVWDDVDCIDYDGLPNQFVIKCTHDSGSTYIVRDKSKYDLKQLNTKLKRHLEKIQGYVSCEPHYLRIKPRIIAEELLGNNNNISSSIIDYKIWCFNQKPYFALVCYDRDVHKHTTILDVYNLNPWHSMREKLADSLQDQRFKDIPEPQNLEEMIDVAVRLSEGFPQVRVDLYNVNGKIYFSELTFTSCAGRHFTYSPQAQLEMGNAIDISQVKTIR